MNGYYQNIVHKKNIEKNIHFLGNRNDISELIKISNVGCSTSIREGLGLNLLEEIANGIPVIASNNRGHRDIVTSENGFYINTEEELEQVLEELINGRYVFDVACLKESVDKFKIENVMKIMKKIYGCED